MSPRCAECPVTRAGLAGVPCEGQTLPIYCETVRAGHPGFAEFVVRLARAHARPRLALGVSQTKR